MTNLNCDEWKKKIISKLQGAQKLGKFVYKETQKQTKLELTKLMLIKISTNKNYCFRKQHKRYPLIQVLGS